MCEYSNKLKNNEQLFNEFHQVCENFNFILKILFNKEFNNSIVIDATFLWELFHNNLSNNCGKSLTSWSQVPL